MKIINNQDAILVDEIKVNITAESEIFIATYVRPVVSRSAAACFAPVRARVDVARVANF